MVSKGNMLRTSRLVIDGISLQIHDDDAFATLRSKFGIPDLSKVLFGSVNEIMSSILQESRNGTTSVKHTQCGNYCIRSISNDEKATLISLLASGYIEKITHPKGSFLTHIYCHFSLGDGAAHFVLMPPVGLNAESRYADITVIEANTVLDPHCVTIPDYKTRERIKELVHYDSMWLADHKITGYTVSMGLLDVATEKGNKKAECAFGVLPEVEVVIDDWLFKSKPHWTGFHSLRKTNQHPSAYASRILKQVTKLLNDVKMNAPNQAPVRFESGSGGGIINNTSSVTSLELEQKVLTGQETVNELLNQAVKLIANDLPSKGVLMYRIAREKFKAANDGKSFKDDKQYQFDKRVKAAETCENELVALLEEMVNEDVWVYHGSGRGTDVSIIKPEFSNGLLRFRCETVLDIDQFSAVAVMSEVEDFKDWFPGLDQSETKFYLSTFRRVVRASGKPPWPFPRNETLLLAYGDTLDAREVVGPHSPLGHGVFIYMRPPGPDVARTPGAHPLDMTGGYWFEDIGNNQTKVVTVLTIDPHVKLPDSLMNWFVINIAYLIHPMLKKQSKKYAPAGKLHHQITENPKVYAELKNRLERLNQRAKTNPTSHPSVSQCQKELSSSSSLSKKRCLKEHQRKKVSKIKKISSKDKLFSITMLLTLMYFTIISTLSLVATLGQFQRMGPSSTLETQGFITGIGFGVFFVLKKQLVSNSSSLYWKSFFVVCGSLIMVAVVSLWMYASGESFFLWISSHSLIEEFFYHMPHEVSQWR